MEKRLAASTSDEALRVPSALHGYRDRLEAGVELGRRNRETVQDLTDQIQRMRQRAQNDAANLERLSTPVTSYTDLRITKDEFLSIGRISSPRKARHKSMGRLDRMDETQFSIPHSRRHRSSPRLDSSDEEREEIEGLYTKLKTELFKNSTLEEMNEMLKEENDAALQANEGLRGDVSGLTTALEQLDSQARNDQQRFQTENTRYRNQLEKQHRQLIDLWKSFTAVKKQLRELHTSTANDMDKQLTEFTRCATMMQKAIRQAENKNRQMEERKAREKNDEKEEILKKYDEIHNKYIQAEKESQEKGRQVMRTETEIRRIKEEKEELERSLHRIDTMAELNGNRKRARSASPSSLGSITVNDVMRRIRSTLHSKSSEIKEFEEKNERLEGEIKRIQKDIQNMEAEKKEKREAEKIQEEKQNERLKRLSEIESDLKRGTERIRMFEEEKESRERVLMNLQESIATIHRQHKEFIEELAERHRDELSTRERLHTTEMEGKIQEEEAKTGKATAEADRLRTEQEEMRQQIREIRADGSIWKKQNDEKDFTILNLEEDVVQLKKKLLDEENKVDEGEKEMIELERKMENVRKEEMELRIQYEELENVNSNLQEDNRSIQEQMTALRNEISELEEKADNSASNVEDYRTRLESQKNAAVEQETSLRSLKVNIQDLEIKLETNNEESRQLKEELENSKNLLNVKITQLNEVVKDLELARRNNELLSEELSNERQSLDAAVGQLENTQKENEKKNNEMNRMNGIMEDLRIGFDRLTNEGKQKDVTIEDIKEQLNSKENELKSKEEKRKEELLRMEKEGKERENELEGEFAEKEKEIIQEKTSLEKEFAQCGTRLTELTKLHEKLMEEELQLRMQADEAKDSLEESREKHRMEVANLQSQNNLDREEWENEREKLEKSKSVIVTELRDELHEKEEKIRRKEESELQLNREIDELKETIEELKIKKEQIEQHREDKDHELTSRENEWGSEKRSLLSSIEELQMKIAKAATELDQMNRKYIMMEKDLVKSENNVEKKSAVVVDFELRMESLMQRISIGEEKEIENKDRMALLERELTEANGAKEKAANRLAKEVHRNEELEAKLREMKKNLDELKIKTQMDGENLQGNEGKIKNMNNKLRHLEIQLADAQAKADTNGDLVRKMETDGSNMVEELKKEQERSSTLSLRNDELNNLTKELKEELEIHRTVLEKRNASSKAATADLLQNYRESERRCLDMQTECEQLKVQVETLNGKLERVDSRRREVEKRLEDGEKRHSELQRRLVQYENSAKAALQMARSQSSLRPGISSIDIAHSPSSGLGDSILRAATSSQDLSMGGSPDKSVHFYDDSGHLDMSSSMEITLRYLKDRIEQLERDKNDLLSEVDDTRKDLNNSGSKLKEVTSTLLQLEKEFNNTQQDNRQLESRLSSQRQLYLSNEETSRSKENELRLLKSRINSAELHLRDKDSQIIQLTNQLEAVKIELSAIQAERQKNINAAKQANEVMNSAEDDKLQLETELNKASRSIRELQGQIKNLQKQLDDSESEKVQLAKGMGEMRRREDRERELLEKLEREERKWREMAVNAKKSSEDMHKNIYEERLATLQHSHDTAVARNRALAEDIERNRQEMREYSSRVSILNVKLAEFEKKSNEERENKNIMGTQLASFKKIEEQWNKIEKEMSEELKQLRRDKLSLTSELEELRRRILKADVERKEIDGCRARMEREVQALKRHVNALEEDKTRTDTAIRETVGERKAIDKSLAAMEKENAELYRNCGQLQAQIQQLERDSGQRVVGKLMKDQNALEARMNKLIQDKRQLELIIEQKDANYHLKKKKLESELAMTREQLEAERRRRAPTQPGGRFERSSDLRMSRTTSINRQKSPFRVSDPSASPAPSATITTQYNVMSPATTVLSVDTRDRTQASPRSPDNHHGYAANTRSLIHKRYGNLAGARQSSSSLLSYYDISKARFGSSLPYVTRSGRSDPLDSGSQVASLSSVPFHSEYDNSSHSFSHHATQSTTFTNDDTVSVETYLH